MARLVRDDIDKFFDADIHLPTRTIFVGSISYQDGAESGTDFQMAERLIKNLHILEHLAPAGDKPITIVMNNPGGDEYDMLAMYDAIKACKNHVTMIGTGKIMSAGAVIFQAADDRVMTANARMMIHYGTWGMHDHPKITYAWTEEGKKVDKLMKDLFHEKIKQKHPNYSERRLDKLLDFDTILNAQEAVDLGLADRVQ